MGNLDLRIEEQTQADYWDGAGGSSQGNYLSTAWCWMILRDIHYAAASLLQIPC